MKKALLILMSFVCLAQSQTDNAADYYSQVLDNLDSVNTYWIVDSLEKGVYDSDHPDLIQFIESQKLNFALIDSGTHARIMEFPEREDDEIWLPNIPMNLNKIGDLLCIRGIFSLQKKDEPLLLKSVEQFNQLILQIDLMSDSDIISIFINVTIIKQLSRLLFEIQLNPSLSKETLKKVFKLSMNTRENQKGFLSYLNHLTENEMLIHEKITIPHTKMYKTDQEKEIHEIIKKKYGLSDAEVDSLASVLNEKYITRLAKQSSKGVSLILTRISSEIYQNYITSFYTNQSIWDIALIGLKCRIFKKENGQFPDRLDQLNIQQINKDPFNKFRPYKLKRIEQDIITLGMV
jgi:hypothetical protein